MIRQGRTYKAYRCEDKCIQQFCRLRNENRLLLLHLWTGRCIEKAKKNGTTTVWHFQYMRHWQCRNLFGWDQSQRKDRCNWQNRKSRECRLFESQTLKETFTVDTDFNAMDGENNIEAIVTNNYGNMETARVKVYWQDKSQNYRI